MIRRISRRRRLRNAARRLAQNSQTVSANSTIILKAAAKPQAVLLLMAAPSAELLEEAIRISSRAATYKCFENCHRPKQQDDESKRLWDA
jgi:hypothetical protein